MNIMFTIVGLINIAVAILHMAILFIGTHAYQYFGAPAYFVQNNHSWYTFGFMLGIILLFFMAGLYALSAASIIRKLPNLTFILLLIGVIYTLRGGIVFLIPFPKLTQFLILSQPNLLGMGRPLLTRDWIFSFVWLIVGLCYLWGGLRHHLDLR